MSTGEIIFFKDRAHVKTAQDLYDFHDAQIGRSQAAAKPQPSQNRPSLKATHVLMELANLMHDPDFGAELISDLKTVLSHYEGQVNRRDN